MKKTMGAKTMNEKKGCFFNLKKWKKQASAILKIPAVIGIILMTLMIGRSLFSTDGQERANDPSLFQPADIYNGGSTVGNLSWRRMDGIYGAVDIDAHPFVNWWVYVIDGNGSRISYLKTSNPMNFTPWQVFCELPDYIYKARRLAITRSKSADPQDPFVIPLVVDDYGNVWELVSVYLGGYSQWRRCYVQVRDIAAGQTRSSVYAISLDGRQLINYEMDASTWTRYNYFPNEYWWSANKNLRVGYPVRVDVAPETGTPWIITSQGYVFYLDLNYTYKWVCCGSNNSQVVGDIAVGGPDRGKTAYPRRSVFSLSSPAYLPYGCNVYQHMVGKQWFPFNGLLSHATVDYSKDIINTIWGINSRGEVFWAHDYSSVPAPTAYQRIKLAKIKYIDNHDWLGARIIVRFYYDGFYISEIDKNDIWDGDTVNYNYYIYENKPSPLFTIRNLKITAEEIDFVGSNDWLKPFSADIDIYEKIDKGMYTIHSKKSDIEYWVEVEIRSTPFGGASQAFSAEISSSDEATDMITPSSSGWMEVAGEPPKPAPPAIAPSYSLAAERAALTIKEMLRTIKPWQKEEDVPPLLAKKFTGFPSPASPAWACWALYWEKVGMADAKTKFPYCHIVATGPNTYNEHYQCRVGTSRRFKPGDLAQIDTGAYVLGYNCDVSRTFPVDCTFSPRQRQLYNLALAAQKDAADFAGVYIPQVNGPGKWYWKTLGQVNARVEEFLRDKSLEWGIYADGKTMDKFMKGLPSVHWIGREADFFGANTGWKSYEPLKPGQVFSIEVGIYLDTTSERYAIHIEDTYEVTENGLVCLSAACPKEAIDILRLRQEVVIPTSK